MKRRASQAKNVRNTCSASDDRMLWMLELGVPAVFPLTTNGRLLTAMSLAS